MHMSNKTANVDERNCRRETDDQLTTFFIYILYGYHNIVKVIPIKKVDNTDCCLSSFIGTSSRHVRKGGGGFKIKLHIPLITEKYT